MKRSIIVAFLVIGIAHEPIKATWSDSKIMSTVALAGASALGGYLTYKYLSRQSAATPVQASGHSTQEAPRQSPTHQPTEGQSQYPSLTAWIDACNTLPPVTAATLNRPTYQTPLTSHEFYSAFIRCTSIMSDYMNTPQQWYGNMPQASLFDVMQEHPFQPFTQKLIITEPEADIIVWGDLHGDIHSFTRTLSILREMGTIDDNFKLTHRDKPCYILTLGDYTDRGHNGLEILYTLFRLKMANPHHVFFARGNHEDAIINMMTPLNGFHTELKRKLSLNGTEPLCKALYRFYDLLPTTIYLGSVNGSITHVMGGCHGGFELGYNPLPFLQDRSGAEFHLLGELKRADAVKELPKIVMQEACKNIPSRELHNFTPICPGVNMPHEPGFLGHMWADFTLDPFSALQFKEGRGFQYNQPITQAVLKAHSGTSERMNINFHGLFRAHQHNGEMLECLSSKESIGAHPLWHSKDSEYIPNQWKKLNLIKHARTYSRGIPLWSGIIYTLFSSPVVTVGLHESMRLCHDAFCILTIRPNFKDWSLTQIAQPL